MSFLRTRPGTSPPTGISAGQWLESRRNEKLNEEAKKPQKYAFLDDSSSEESFAATDFLKRTLENKGNLVSSGQKKLDVKVSRPKTAHGTTDKFESSPQRSRSGGVLSRFADLEKQILSRPSNIMVMSSSDMDLDISSDSEIKRDVRNLKEINNPQTPSLPPSHEDSVSTSFLPLQHKEEVSDLGTPGLVPKKKVVTFATNLTQHQSNESDVSLDDFLPDSYNTDNVSFDDVLPQSNFVTSISLDEAKSGTIFNLQSVDDLLPAMDSQQHDSITSKSHSLSSVDTDSNIYNLHSIEELVDGPQSNLKVEAPAAMGTSLTNIQDEVKEEVGEYSDEYSNDFHSDEDDTLKETESITEEVSEEIKTEDVSSSINDSIPTQMSHSSSVSYTESFESETLTSSDSSQSRTHRNKAPGVVEIGVQTDHVRATSTLPKIEFTESEKTFYKPSQVLNNEALAVLSSYSPAVLAVQDMLKQQLSLTRDFIVRSERLHKAASDALVPDYQYASLEEARQIIRMQREKLNLPSRSPIS